MPNELQQLKDQIAKLQSDLQALSSAYYNGNFSANQDFSKSCSFNGRLKVPHFATLPTTGQVGEVFESGGKLYIVSAVNTNTVVGGQS